MPRNLANRHSAPPPAVYEVTNEAERLRELAYIGRFLAAIRAHWKLFVGVLAGFVVLVTVGTLVVPKRYTASVKMIVGSAGSAIDAEQRSSTLPVLNALVLQSSDLSSDTVAELVQEGPVVDKVISTLGLKASRTQVLSQVSVKPVLNTAILNLSVTWRSPEQAAAIANTFSTVFVERERDLIRSQAVSAENYLQQAINQAQTNLQNANGALSAFQAKVQIADITSQTQGLIQRLETDESQIAELQEDQKQAEAQLASAQSQLRTVSATVAGQQATDVNPAAAQLRQQLADAEVQLATARQRYTDKYPEVIALTQQVSQLRKAIAAMPADVPGGSVAVPNPVYQQLQQQASNLQSQIQGDGAKIAVLEQQRKSLLPTLAALPSKTQQLAFLQERAKLASDVYTALQQKYDDAVVAANSAISDVTVVQSASPQHVDVSPNILFNLAAAIAIGLILASLAVAIVDAIGRRIRGDDDVERVVGLPVIAHIPNVETKRVEALPWLQTVNVEAFLHLCASLRLRGGPDARIVVVTSPEKGDGKSTIAFQLAGAMSRIRPHVLLIDADMRCPAAHIQANIRNRVGLSDVLCSLQIFDHAVEHISSSFDILTAGTIPENPVGLIESTNFDRFLELVRARYDYVVIDTAALHPVVDSVLIASRADATALVLSADTSSEKLAGEAADRLRALGVDNVIGVIMNRARTSFSDYSDYFSTRSTTSPLTPLPKPSAENGTATVVKGQL
jgi:polysaccharide biosynthesis transport protein